MNAAQLRKTPEEELPQITDRQPLYFIADNVLDTYNIGGLFRLADALCVSKLYIGGESEAPPNHKIVKASVGTYKVVPWAKIPTLQAIRELRETVPGIMIMALEQTTKSIDYDDMTMVVEGSPVALIVGNETYGLGEETLNACDYTVQIPMYGLNNSLNVIVAMGIVGYAWRNYVRR